MFGYDGLSPMIERLHETAATEAATAASTRASWSDSQRTRFDREFVDPIRTELARLARELESANHEANAARQLLLQAR